MIIKRLELHNFGVYAGRNVFEFNSKKPIVLIGGMNGRGKTTFLEAVLLALYGSNSFAYAESKAKSYSQYLKSFVNRTATGSLCCVELDFQIIGNITEEYRVIRQWDATSLRPREDITVFKDGKYSEFLTNNWPLFIENLLPSALSSFFFFDGEKIAELAVDNTSSQLKESIRAMLGITTLDVLENDIRRTINRIKRNSADSSSEDTIISLREAKETACNDLANIDEELEKAYSKLSDDNDTLAALHNEYTSKGGDAFEKKQEIIQRKADLTAQLSVEENKLYELAAELLPLVLVNDLVNDVKLQATDERNDSIMKESSYQLERHFRDFKRKYNGNTESCSDFIEYIKTIIENNNVESVYDLSDQALFQANNLIDTQLSSAKKEAIKIIKDKVSIQKQLDELESYLSLDINDSDIKKVYKKIKKTEQLIISDQVAISELNTKRAEANSRAIKSTSEYKKYVEAYLATEELKDNSERSLKYSNMALSVIEKYKVALQKQKTNELARTITACYKKMANKSNLISKIVMNPESLELTYMSGDETIIPADSLSAGEQQLMVISVLWALSICSKKKLPVIIDTPLSRMDSLHRKSLITKYFPHAGEQTIILSTDSEIDEKYYKLMAANIGDEYTLIYDETEKSTSIQKGYLIGAGS